MAEKLESSNLVKPDHIVQALILTAQAKLSQELESGTISEVVVLR